MRNAQKEEKNTKSTRDPAAREDKLAPVSEKNKLAIVTSRKSSVKKRRDLLIKQVERQCRGRS